MQRVTHIAFALLLALYPLAVFFGFRHFSAQTLGLLLLAFAALRLFAGWLPTRNLEWSTQLPALAMVLIGALTILRSSEWVLRFYPVLVNISMLAVFAFSLRWPPTIIERLARLREPDLDAHALTYIRHVTQAWCIFFVINGSISAWTAVAGDWQMWTLYNGLVSYVLMGAMFAGEWLVRRHVRGTVA
jgi:uncharacterized membrane protein